MDAAFGTNLLGTDRISFKRRDELVHVTPTTIGRGGPSSYGGKIFCSEIDVRTQEPPQPFVPDAKKQ